MFLFFEGVLRQNKCSYFVLIFYETFNSFQLLTFLLTAKISPNTNNWGKFIEGWGHFIKVWFIWDIEYLKNYS